MLVSYPHMYPAVHQRKSRANCGTCVESSVTAKDTTEIEVVEYTDQPSRRKAGGKQSSETRRAFDHEFKLRVVNDYSRDGKNIAWTARKFEIDSKQVRSWINKEEKIRNRRANPKQMVADVMRDDSLVEDRLYKEFLNLRK